MSLLVSPGGFEPPVSGSASQRSIQLSYGDEIAYRKSYNVQNEMVLRLEFHNMCYAIKYEAIFPACQQL